MSTRAGFVAIAGRPNAGKSTLLNRVVGGEVSIVTPKAQTTRERVLGILTQNDGQIVFIDTPGIHRAREGGINHFMVEEAREALQDVSAVWYLVDPRSEVQHETVVLELLRKVKAPIFLVMNKGDMCERPPLSEQRSGLRDRLMLSAREMGIEFKASHDVSARTGLGVEGLLSATWQLIPESPFYYEDPDQLSDRPVRYFVAEKVREQLLLRLGEEVPYSCAVEIESFDEQAKPPRIEAVIHVERDSQKGIVIGKGAQKIKEIGQAARERIEDFLGGRVHLGLRVKVLPEWSRDPHRLERLGYILPNQRGAGSRRENRR
jgi:GTP-binding protein Era